MSNCMILEILIQDFSLTVINEVITDTEYLLLYNSKFHATKGSLMEGRLAVPIDYPGFRCFDIYK